MLPRAVKLWLGPHDYDDFGRKRLGAWSQSYSGEKYWIMDPLPEEVHLVDIVMGLANAARYRGQTMFFYSVLQHSVLVSQAVERIALEKDWSPKKTQIAAFHGLFHDGTEAFLGDVARPLKRMRAMREYRRVEQLWEDAIFKQLDVKVENDTAELVKEVDNRIVIDEIYAIMADPDMWHDSGRYVGMKPLGVVVEPLSREEVINRFYKRYEELK